MDIHVAKNHFRNQGQMDELIIKEVFNFTEAPLESRKPALIFKQLQSEVSRDSHLVAPTGFEPVFED